MVYTEDWEKHMTPSFRATAKPALCYSFFMSCCCTVGPLAGCGVGKAAAVVLGENEFDP